MTYISRKELFDLLNSIREEEVSNEREDSLLRLIAKEILLMKTVEVEDKNNNE